MVQKLNPIGRIASIAVVIAVCSASGEDGVAPPEKATSDKDFKGFAARVAEKKRTLLDRERTRPSAAWAGMYSRQTFDSSDGWIISKDEYVSTSRLIDMGLVQVAGMRIRLKSMSPARSSPERSSELELVVVTWGQRSYLVEPEMMISFCNAVNSGQAEYSGCLSTAFYTRDHDYNRKTSGMPAIPREYRQYLLEKRIDGVITEVKSRKTGVVAIGYPGTLDGLSAIVDMGSKDGLRPGMELFFSDGEPDGIIYVIAVESNKCEVLIVGLSAGKTAKGLAGSHLSTKDPFYLRSRR